MTINYDVTENTRVFIYAANDDAPTSPNSNGARRVAYANDDSVKLFGLSVMVDKDDDSIGSLNANETTKPLRIYDLQGREVKTSVKGVYIINGRKVMVP